jgi:hypothetical protein
MQRAYQQVATEYEAKILWLVSSRNWKMIRSFIKKKSLSM